MLGLMIRHFLLGLTVCKSLALAANCPDIGSIKYADVISSRDPPFTPGTVLKIKCDKGYKGHGVPKLKCQKDGTWSDLLPFCTVSKCQRDEKKLEKGRKCPQACKKNKDCSQFKRCECDDWCGRSCVNAASKCKRLTPPENGYIEGTVISYGNRVRYRCNDGFSLLGSATRKCRSDKKWSGRAPKCLPFGSCGVSNGVDERDMSGKVVEGTDAEEGAWPWQAVLFYNAGYTVAQFYDRHNAFGGGTIIDQKWILTAAHLFDSIVGTQKTVNWKTKFLITIGMTRYPDPDEEIPDYVKVIEPESVYRHESYDPMTYDYDVALIQVGNSLIRNGRKFVVNEDAKHGIIKFSRYIKPVCLPCMKIDPQDPVPNISSKFVKDKCNKEARSRSLTIAGTQVIVTGFGWARRSGEQELFRPKTMQEGVLKIESDNVCLDTVRQNSDDGRYTERMLCASSANESLRTDACNGDSGGPIVKQIKTDERTKHWVQVGVVSWGFNIGCGKAAGFYVNLPAVMPWLWKMISDVEKGACEFPPRLSTGFPNVDQSKDFFNVGDTVTYKCRFGYTLSGNPNITCLANHTWSSARFLCSKVSCGKPLTPENGFIEGNDFSYGSWVIYKCNKGYEILEPVKARRYCSITTEWSGTPPKCEISKAKLDVQVGEMLYKFNTDKVSWWEAHRLCDENDFRLAISIDDTVQKALEEKISEIEKDDEALWRFWINGRDTDPDNIWIFANGTVILPELQKWGPDEPNRVGMGLQCIELSILGWNDHPCSTTAGYICQKVSKAKLDVQVGEMLYKFNTDKVLWWEAHRLCDENGFRLAISIDDTVQKALEEKIAEIEKDDETLWRFWINGRDTSPENIWIFANGTVIQPELQIWGLYEPNRVGIGLMCIELSVLGWNDNPCSTTAGYICQKGMIS